MNATSRSFLLCIAAFFFSAAITAQTKEADSLYNLIKQSSPARKVEIYAKLTSLTHRTNSDTALFFATKAFELAAGLDDDYSILLANSAMGRALSTKGQYNLSKKYLDEALRLALKQQKDSIASEAYAGIGNCLWQLGRHAEALENHFKSLRIREQINNTSGIASSKINIGMVYQSQDKIELAERYIREAITELKDDNESSIKASALHTLANIYGMQGKIADAMALDKEGIALAERTNNEFAKAMFYDNMANCYLYGDPPDYKLAFEYFTRTLQLDSAFGNKKQMSDSYLNLGNVFFFQKKHIEAIPYLQRSIVLAEASGYAGGKQTATELMARAYQLSGQPDLAFKTLQQANRIKDSLVNEKSESKIAELQTIYETEKKQQQIELQKEQLSKKNYILAGIIIVFLLIALLGISFYRRYRLKQKTHLQNEILKQQELATKAVLEAEEKERQRIAKDLHDGIGQMMSAAKMNLSTFESETAFTNTDQKISFDKAVGLIDESCREIRVVSHNIMPNALLKNSLASAIREFIEKLDQKKLQVHLYTEGLDERLDSNTETVLYRVVQECVNNVIKHSGASTLDISVVKDKDGINATIEDNGKGFDTTDKEKFEGIGLKNIITRVEYLKGTVDFDSAPGRGTLVAIHTPLA